MNNQYDVKISIVVPVYNVENYIEKCLNSLVKQTLKEIEIIVVDDGTPDNSVEIIKKFENRYSNLHLVQKKNGGLSDARNCGMTYCKGEYIGFVDSDDYVEPDMYEALYREAKKTGADLVVCDYVKEYANGSRIVKARQYTSSKDMFLGGLAAAWNKIYKKDLIERSGAVFPKGLIYEDTDFFCRLIPYVTGCGYVNRAFVHYIQREGSIANTQGKKIAVIFDVFDKILEYYDERQFTQEYRDELTYFTVRVLLGSSMERICRCDDKRTRNELLAQTMDYLDKRLCGWRKNRYLAGWKDKRNLYMRNVYRWNIKWVSVLLRLHFLRTDEKLL